MTASSLALALREGADIREAQAIVLRLVATNQAEELDETRIRAEAAALYQHRLKNAAREHDFGCLRLLCEAGLGVLSFSDPDVVKPATRLAAYRALAAALERGELLALARKTATKAGLSTDAVAIQVRRAGLTRVPAGVVGPKPLFWGEARATLINLGRDLTKIPPDREYLRELQRRSDEQWRKRAKRKRAAERLERAEARRRATILARDRGPQLETAYSLLRKTLQAFHDAQGAFTAEERRRYSFDTLFASLYEAEDILVRALAEAPK